MRTHYSITFLLLMAIAFLESCSASTGVPTSLFANPTITPTRIPTEQPVTFTPEPSLTASVTPPPPENILKFQRFQIVSDLPADIKPAGALVFWSEPLQLLHFEPQIHMETIQRINSDGLCFSTSPDGKWLAYCQFSDESPKGQWLFVESADWQQQKRIPIDTSLAHFGPHLWLDNEHLIFTRIQGDHRPRAFSMVAINPFTEEQFELYSNYPNLLLSPAGPEGRMDFAESDVVYDPSLDLVIFPSSVGGVYIVLWDRQSKSILAKVNGAVGYYPLWSPDAQQFAVPLLYPLGGETILEEWFRVSRDGQVEQLTHFSDYFTSAEFGPGYSWSPDGQKLAFWLDVSPSLCPGLNLAILDIPTKQVTDSCIHDLPGYGPPPIWSLDGRYIVVVHGNTRPRQTLLVDIEQSQAFNITEKTQGARPIGWLISP